MEDLEFDKRVAELRELPIPAAPGGLESNVLRRIRSRRGESGAWSALWDWLPRPAVAAAALAVIIGSSFATSAIALHSQSSTAASEARAALGFDAFRNPIQLPTDHR